jgi:UDP-N-acetylglucosamine--N-acetylmuramyl-(pentapeptide) pyrophosphoryl-undecaprenol N-acetylglucosamine transferase
MSDRVILIAGGGTGGHVFPAVAVAEAARALADVDVIFCGTARGLEASVIPQRGFRLEQIQVEPIKGVGAARAFRGLFVAARATTSALVFFRAIRPRAVLSVGGYAAGPAALAAAMNGVPLAILEPNSVAGLTNRIVGPLAKRAYIAWEETRTTFRTSAIRKYGVPIRSGFAPRPYSAHRPPRLLVIGGSQGSQALNDRLPAAVADLASRGVVVEVLHQAGRSREDAVRKAYDRARVKGATVVPFIDDMVQAVSNADLVVSRAGAGTIAEVTAIGRAALLVPFPDAADDHQAKNAAALARHGAAVSLLQRDASPARLATEAERMLRDEPLRVAMANAAASLGRPAAAYDVAADLLALARLPLRERDAAPPEGARHQTSGSIRPSAGPSDV